VSAPVALPWRLRALAGEREVDCIAGLDGRGRVFEADASWTPLDAGAPVAGWDVVVEVRSLANEPIDAGLEIAVALEAVDDPHWLIPGLLYGENRPAASTARYPRFGRDGGDDDPWTAPAWGFRSDRAATPVAIARDATRTVALATPETSPLGLTGLAVAARADRTELALRFPYREEPVAYDGSPTPRPRDLPTHRWRPGATAELTFRVYVTEPAPHATTPILRHLHAWLAPSSPLNPWVDAPTAATLAAEGLVRWHFRPDPPVLIETAAFVRTEARDGDRLAMHVGWVSGAPAATALLLHGRRTGDDRAAEAGRAVLDHIADNLAPCGTFWGQWTATAGWTKGWTPGEEAVHARTLGEAATFLGRAAAAQPTPAWQEAVERNLDFVVAAQRSDGAIPAAWNAVTGEPQRWDGTAGLAWVPALVEAGRVGPARRAGAFYARFVDDELLFGAPEDVDLGPTSEDGYVAVMAYVALAESAENGAERARWIDLARRSADWALTFRYAYNVAFPAGSTLADLDFRSRGADQASPANQHLHSYGLLCLPELVRLSRLARDPHYAERAREHLACYRQLIARHDDDFGARRGMTPERLYQTACFGPKGELGPLSHAWCLGLLLYAADVANDLPELAEPAR
jgi:hypothetical protein